MIANHKTFFVPWGTIFEANPQQMLERHEQVTLVPMLIMQGALDDNVLPSGHGHVFQERFWSGAIFDDQHFLSALRYIEFNPVAGQLVSHAEKWPWSSLALRNDSADRVMDRLPFALPADWSAIVNEEPTPGDAD